MSQEFKDPYASMNFDPTAYNQAIEKAKASWDATLQEAGYESGMAAGTSGMDVRRVTADVYAKTAGERDKTISAIELQRAQAQTQFNTEKQRLQAEAKKEYEANKSTAWDWVSGGLGFVTSLAQMNPFGILSGGYGMVNKALVGGGKGRTQFVGGPVSQPNTAGLTTDFSLNKSMFRGINPNPLSNSPKFTISSPKLTLGTQNSSPFKLKTGKRFFD